MDQQFYLTLIDLRLTAIADMTIHLKAQLAELDRLRDQIRLSERAQRFLVVHRKRCERLH
jgi:hypothetical protein